MDDLLSQVASELEDLRHWNKSHHQQQEQQHGGATPEKHSRDTSPKHKRFPNACIRLLRSIPGNLRCVDCDATNPQWASISYGILLCIECSGKHRRMGVQVCFDIYVKKEGHFSKPIDLLLYIYTSKHEF